MFRFLRLLVCAWACWWLVGSARIGMGGAAGDVIDPQHPAIAYTGTRSTDPVARLMARVAAGETQLAFEPGAGYLRSLLEALRIPVESQTAVFSKTSLQARLITAHNPRTIFFNDSVAVAWMPGGFIEIAAHDPQQGAIFYMLPQVPGAGPVRDNGCLQCHYAAATLGVPGFLARSVPSAPDGAILPWLGNYTTDHRSPIEERWGGWYVTGRGGGRHLGNAPVTDRSVPDVPIVEANLAVDTLREKFDSEAYLSPHSDIVALLVLDHQLRMMNLLTRAGWQARIAAHEQRDPAAVAARQEEIAELVDYMLFVDEAPLRPVQGSSRFADAFARQGRRDRQGRSLRDLDLQTRLLKYPCSYMIYSEAFTALPPAAKGAIFQRLWDVLSGRDAAPRYARLTTADREAIVEILRETVNDLPEYFFGPV